MKRKLLAAVAVLFMFTIPLSAFAVYENLTQEQADSYYFKWMLSGTVLFLLTAGCFYIYWRHFANADKRPVKQKKTIKVSADKKEILQNVMLIIGIGLLVRVIAAAFSIGYGNDVALFKYWGNTAANGLFDTYNVLGENIDYPPGYVYILYICGMLAKLLGAQTAAYEVIIRLPAILCDCGIAYFIYMLCRDRAPKSWTYFFTALWMFNPLSFLDSTVWGQVDAVLTLALVAALYLIMRERFILSAAVFGVAVMLKPQAIIVLPVLCFALFKNKKVSTFIYSALAGIGTAIGVALPFALHVDMTTEYMSTNVNSVLAMLHADGGGTLTKLLTPFAWILSLFMGTAGHYDYACVNALNFFFGIGANWTKDSEPFLGLTYFSWGMIFIVLAAALTWFLYIKTKKNPSLPFISSAVILLLVVNFGPRMHERYFFPAVAFLIIAAVLRNNRTLLGIAAAASAAGFFTVLEILVDLNLGKPYMWPEISFIRLVLSYSNVLIALGTAAFAIADSFGKIENTRLDKKIWRQ